MFVFTDTYAKKTCVRYICTSGIYCKSVYIIIYSNKIVVNINNIKCLKIYLQPFLIL